MASSAAFTRVLQQTGRVPADTYVAILSRWGARGAVELTAVIGYYTMVAQTLNAHQLPLPEGAGLLDAPVVAGIRPAVEPVRLARQNKPRAHQASRNFVSR